MRVVLRDVKLGDIDWPALRVAQELGQKVEQLRHVSFLLQVLDVVSLDLI